MNRVLVPRAGPPLRREKGRPLLYLFRPAAPVPGPGPGGGPPPAPPGGLPGTWARGLFGGTRRRLGPAGTFPMRSAFFPGYPRGRGGLRPPPGQAGRSTGTRPPAASLPPSRPAPPTTAAAGPKAPPWPGWLAVTTLPAAITRFSPGVGPAGDFRQDWPLVH